MADKILLPYRLELTVIYDCNQECPYCAHFVPYLKGIVPFREIEQTCEEWSNLIEPQQVFIMGGEATIHPDIIEIIYLFNRHWRNVVLATNGTTLHEMPCAFFEAVERTNTRIDISFNDSTQKYESEIRQFVQDNNMNNCRFYNKRFTKQYQIIDGKVAPFHNPRICGGNTIFTLLNNRLYKCTTLPRALLCYQMEDRYSVTIHDDIEKFIRSTYTCPFCPRHLHYIDDTPT
jgi:sulfatase maturation enzyme AslB (radical SAM superfamily)